MTDSTLVRVCPACQAKNRSPAGRLADTARCGACKAEMGPWAEPVDADPALFQAVVASAHVPVLVDFWASWCAPCRMAAPEVARVAKEMAGRALVLKVNTEAHPQLAARFGVQGIPNFVVLKGGQVAFQRAGAAPAREMRRWIESVATG